VLCGRSNVVCGRSKVLEGLSKVLCGRLKVLSGLLKVPSGRLKVPSGRLNVPACGEKVEEGRLNVAPVTGGVATTIRLVLARTGGCAGIPVSLAAKTVEQTTASIATFNTLAGVIILINVAASAFDVVATLGPCVLLLLALEIYAAFVRKKIMNRALHKSREGTRRFSRD
jgi:hypothetical protein